MEGKITPELLNRYAKGLCDEQERKQVENWLENSDEPHKSFINSEHADHSLLEEELWKGFSAKRDLVLKQNIRIQNLVFQMAAACFIGFSLFAGFYYFEKINQDKSAATSTAQVPEVSFTAPDGKASTIFLPDHSMVVLAAGSSVHYPSAYSGTIRSITFESGEAFFDIKHDSAKPFLVKTSGAEVRVLGTRFNIKNEKASSKIAVTLVQGSIGFSGGKSNSQILKPGQQLSYDKKTLDITGVAEVDTRYATAWTTDLLWFKDTPFKEVLDRTALHYGVRFQVQGNIDLQSLLNGKFENKPLPYMLRLLENSTGYKFRQQGSVVYINE